MLDKEVAVYRSLLDRGPEALLECWASGVRVISTRVGMPADTIVHGNKGMLVRIGISNHCSIALLL